MIFRQQRTVGTNMCRQVVEESEKATSSIVDLVVSVAMMKRRSRRRKSILVKVMGKVKGMDQRSQGVGGGVGVLEVVLALLPAVVMRGGRRIPPPPPPPVMHPHTARPGLTVPVPTSVLGRVVKKTVFFISCFFFGKKTCFFHVFFVFFGFFPCIRFLHF